MGRRWRNGGCRCDKGNLPFHQMVFLAGNQQLHCAFLNVNDLQLLVPVPDDSVRGKVAETAQIPGAGKFRRPVRIQFPSGRVNVQSAILKSHKSAPCLFCYIIRRYSDCVKRVSAVLYKGNTAQLRLRVSAVFCSTSAVPKMGNTYSIPPFSEL